MIGDASLAVEVARKDSAPGDLPRDASEEAEIGTGLGSVDDEGCLWSFIEGARMELTCHALCRPTIQKHNAFIRLELGHSQYLSISGLSTILFKRYLITCRLVPGDLIQG